MTADGVGTCGPGDNQAQAGHIICVTGGGGVTHTLTSEGADASEDGTGRGTPVVVQPLALRGRDQGAELEIGPEGGPYNCLRAGNGGSSRSSRSSLIAITAPVAVHENQRGEITTRDTIGLTTGGGKPGQGYPAVMSVYENQQGEIYESPTTNALASAGGKPGQGYAAIRDNTIVRRLTPMECERLQGFPDGWTDGQSDAQRYRQMGNAVAVPVVEWIAQRLITIDQEEK